MPITPEHNTAHISVRDLSMAYGENLIQRDLNFTVNHGDIFIIMGGSGCGKSTLLRHMIGLMRPKTGSIHYKDCSFWDQSDRARTEQLKSMGVLYQSGALWSSMTLAQNIAIAMETHTKMPSDAIRNTVSLKLSLVGLAGFEDYYPSEISGGMQKRAGLARAMALDPDILLFDEPSAGLDPISAKRLDDLILELRNSLGTTIVVVTHELSSIFAIGNNSVFLDTETKTMIAQGNPESLRDSCPNEKVRQFLMRGSDTNKGRS